MKKVSIAEIFNLRFSNPSRPPAHKASIKNRKWKIECSQTGAALIITLSILVLVTALVLALFLAVTHERTESAAVANQGDAQRLAASVVNLVKSTITQTTMGWEANADGSPMPSRPSAWASQPGLIRTWKQDGTADKSYRLYSSGDIVNDGKLDLASEQIALNTWKTGAPVFAGSYNALFCDLNAPALNQFNERIYPIVTPPADNNSGSTATDPVDGLPTDNSATSTQEGVQGFSVTASPGYGAVLKMRTREN